MCRCGPIGAAGRWLRIAWGRAILPGGNGARVLWVDAEDTCTDEGGTPCANGDANGDGMINVSDAVYLFAGGPEPVAIAAPSCDAFCPPCSQGTLPSPGQGAAIALQPAASCPRPGEGRLKASYGSP